MERFEVFVTLTENWIQVLPAVALPGGALMRVGAPTRIWVGDSAATADHVANKTTTAILRVFIFTAREKPPTALPIRCGCRRHPSDSSAGSAAPSHADRFPRCSANASTYPS